MKTRFLFSIAISLLLSATLFLPRSVARSTDFARSSTHPAATPVAIVTIVRTPSDPPLSALIAKQTAIPSQQRAIIEQILSLLPAGCEDSIRNFYVRYDNPSNRGLAGKDTIIVSGSVPNNEFRALLVHEILGHVADLGCIQGTPSSGASAFMDGTTPIFKNDPSTLFYQISWRTSKERKTDSQGDDFVSGYAASDPFEDEAESATFFLLHRDTFAKMAKTNPALAQKYLWLQNYLFGSLPSYARSTYVWNSSDIPWDTTKLPYQWTGAPKVAWARSK